jgi:hypothetical protein
MVICSREIAMPYRPEQTRKEAHPIRIWRGVLTGLVNACKRDGGKQSGSKDGTLCRHDPTLSSRLI